MVRPQASGTWVSAATTAATSVTTRPARGFDYFHGLPLTNLTGLQAGRGQRVHRAFRLLVFVPLQLIRVALLTLAMLKWLRLCQKSAPSSSSSSSS